MDLLTLVMTSALAFEREDRVPSISPFPIILAAEQELVHDRHPLFPLLETPARERESDHEIAPNLETQTGISERNSSEPNGSIFVPLGAPDHPRNDTAEDPLFVPLSRDQQED